MKRSILRIPRAALLAAVVALTTPWMMIPMSEAQSNPASGLKITDRKAGTGAEAVPGKQVTVHYTGWLFDATAKDNKGKKFDSSLDRKDPFAFGLGAGQVIRGWDQGVAGMKVGGQRTLVIPPEMAYGKRGFPPVIPPDSTLVFEVELLGVG